MRLLGFHGAVFFAGNAWAGIVAGCSLATTLVSVYTMPVYDSFAVAWGNVRLGVMIDDAPLQVASKSADEVVDTLAHAGEDLLEKIEVDLCCKVNLDKAAVVASTRALGKRVLARFGVLGGALKDTTPNLGADFGAGAKRKKSREIRSEGKGYKLQGEGTQG